MASIVNIGQMKDKITLHFITGSTADAQGSRTPTYKEVEVWGDVQPMRFDVAQRMNLNFLDSNYFVTCRAKNYARCAKVDYAGNEYTVISQEEEKDKQFLKLIMKRKV
jgi:hypothetical protein